MGITFRARIVKNGGSAVRPESESRVLGEGAAIPSPSVRESGERCKLPQWDMGRSAGD